MEGKTQVPQQGNSCFSRAPALIQVPTLCEAPLVASACTHIHTSYWKAHFLSNHYTLSFLLIYISPSRRNGEHPVFFFSFNILYTRFICEISKEKNSKSSLLPWSSVFYHITVYLHHRIIISPAQSQVNNQVIGETNKKLEKYYSQCKTIYLPVILFGESSLSGTFTLSSPLLSPSHPILSQREFKGQ